MRTLLTTQDVLNDIEFELAQGAISQDDLGQSIQAVRQYQNRLRTRAFDTEKPAADVREILGQQFQMNDMLLTTLQAMAATLHTQQAQIQRLGQWQPQKPAAPVMDSAVSLNHLPISTIPATAVPLPTSWEAPPDELLQATTEIKNITEESYLTQLLDVRPATMPVVGGFVTRLRSFFHSLVLFYVNRMAKQQTAVNQTLAHWLLQTQAKLWQQQEEIAWLRQQVASLQGEVSSEQ